MRRVLEGRPQPTGERSRTSQTQPILATDPPVRSFSSHRRQIHTPGNTSLLTHTGLPQPFHRSLPSDSPSTNHHFIQRTAPRPVLPAPARNEQAPPSTECLRAAFPRTQCYAGRRKYRQQGTAPEGSSGAAWPAGADRGAASALRQARPAPPARTASLNPAHAVTLLKVPTTAPGP